MVLPLLHTLRPRCIAQRKVKIPDTLTLRTDAVGNLRARTVIARLDKRQTPRANGSHDSTTAATIASTANTPEKRTASNMVESSWRAVS